MANQPFDTTIINPLERPKSSDINAAQSELHRDLQDYLKEFYTYSLNPSSYTSQEQSRFIGKSFAVVPSSGMTVNITKGMGFEYLAIADSNINGIAGLNDLSYYKPLYLAADKAVTVPTAPGAGKCRRDLITVRVNRKLTDLTPSDQYQLASGVFQATNLYKTMTFALDNETVQYIPAGSLTPATSAIVYRMGAEVSFTTFDDFLAAPIPSTDIYYLPIAVINVGPGYSSIAQVSINDRRNLLGIDSAYSVTGSAIIGGADASATPTPVQPQLSNVVIRAPAGVRAAITKSTSVSPVNKYTLTVVGCPSATDIEAFFTITSSGSTAPYITYSRPVMAAIQSRAVNVVCDSSRQTVLASSATSPVLNVAIGQVVHTVDFTVGFVYPKLTGNPVTAVDMLYVTDVSDFTSNGSTTETVNTCFNIKVAV